MKPLLSCLIVALVMTFAFATVTPAFAQSFDEMVAEFEAYETTFKGYGNGPDTPPSCASGANVLGNFTLASAGDTLLLGLLAGALVLGRKARHQA